MNNKTYLTKLEKCLSGLDKPSKQDILQEIKSYTNDSDSPLIDRFGSPEELAKQYLDGVITAPKISKKIFNITKKLIIVMSLAFTALLLTVGIAAWYIAKDKFNYADINAKQLDTSSVVWKSIAAPSELNIHINHAKAVLYWHDKDTVTYQCSREKNQRIDSNVLKIHSDNCFLFVPKQTKSININAAKVVLVEPESSLDIKIDKTNLKIAENEKFYNYDITGERYKVSKNLRQSETAEITLSIEAFKATVEEYEY